MRQRRGNAGDAEHIASKVNKWSHQNNERVQRQLFQSEKEKLCWKINDADTFDLTTTKTTLNTTFVVFCFANYFE